MARLKVGLIGCGGRGTGAVVNALDASEDIEVVAWADLFKDKVDSTPARMKDSLKRWSDKEKADRALKRLEFSQDKMFSGWDCAEKLCELDLDIVIDASPPVFRPSHAKAIIGSGKNAFLEKPAGVDPTQMHQMMEVAKLADQKGLCIVCGTQRHYANHYLEGIARVQNGEIGKILAAYCYWNQGGYVGDGQTKILAKSVHTKDLVPDDTMYQIRDWTAFIWTSGDHIVEQHVHNIDVIAWGLGYDRLPVEVNGMGGRALDLPVPQYGDRFSHFDVDFDMGDGLHIISYCRQEPGTTGLVGERFVGEKGVIEFMGDAKQFDSKGKLVWQCKPAGIGPYTQEHVHLIDCVKNGKKVNDLHNLIVSNTFGIAGRMSAFSGKRFKYDWVMSKSKESLMPKDLKAPKTPITGVPVPGKYKLV